MKKLICLWLCLVLLLPALPVRAADQSESGKLCQQMADDYRTILKSTNRRTLSGYCGLCASWQLYLLGINDWVMSYHGCNQFNAYCDLAVTGGGHRVEAYGCRDYTLTEALNAVSKSGTRDVYNILVGFETTNTALGSIYGHSMVIYGILDGVVHFCESYDTPFGRAGVPARTSIEEFAAYYDGRGVFEGIIYFGKAGYAANCEKTPANLFVQVREDTALYTQPCAPGTEDSALLRSVRRGERLWANAILENPQGQLYYRVDDGQAGYLPVENTEPFRFIYEDISIAEPVLPQQLEPGEDCAIAGRVSAEYSDITGLQLSVTDDRGREVLNNAMAKHSGVYDLERDVFSNMLDFGTLAPGTYTCTLTAYAACGWWDGSAVRQDRHEQVVVSQGFSVGQGFAPAEPAPETPEKDGWVWENGTWYCYDGGQPRTGWYCDGGGDYYLKENGAVTTGWAIIQGKPRYFSRSGCMRTGWLDTPDGRMYLLFNGVPATGLRTIEGQVYTFDREGYLQA